MSKHSSPTIPAPSYNSCPPRGPTETELLIALGTARMNGATREDVAWLVDQLAPADSE